MRNDFHYFVWCLASPKFYLTLRLQKVAKTKYLG